MNKVFNTTLLFCGAFTILFTFTIWYSFIRDNPLTSVIDLPPTYVCEHDPIADLYLCANPDQF